ncbi:UNVERIFIED_CONTAM: hypothetical protein DES50_102763 [Williamsia faeni]
MQNADITGAVFTFVIANKGTTPIEDGNWRDPSLVYGPNGTPAQTAMPFAGQGDPNIGQPQQSPIPAGSKQTIRVGYDVPKSALTDAVLTEGSITWQGDFSNFGN